MKKYLSYFAISAVIGYCIGCKKNTPILLPSLQGTWELRQDINGFSGKSTYYSSGNGHILKFTATTYADYSKDTLLKSGTYEVRADTFHLYNQLKNRIIYDHEENSIRDFFDIQNNRLTFMVDANDGPGVVYERIR